MTVYLLEWDTREEPGERSIAFLGVFSSPEKRERARELCLLSERYKQGHWPFNEGGAFLESEAAMDSLAVHLWFYKEL